MTSIVVNKKHNAGFVRCFMKISDLTNDIIIIELLSLVKA